MRIVLHRIVFLVDLDLLQDTSLKFQQQSHDLTRATLGGMKKISYNGGYSSNQVQNPYSMQTKDGVEDINWLL